MDNETRAKIGKDIIDNMQVTKEQYIQICKLADELDLDYPVKEESMDDLLNNL